MTLQIIFKQKDQNKRSVHNRLELEERYFPASAIDFCTFFSETIKLQFAFKGNCNLETPTNNS